MSEPRRLVLPAGALAEGPVTLPEELGRHVRDVLRLELGAALSLLDGAGLTAVGRLVSLERRRVVVECEAPRAAGPPPVPRIRLLQAVAKGEKVDAVVRQATELGAAIIQLVLTQRAVARQENRLERWRAIAEDAVRVSGRPYRPEVLPPRPLSEVLGGSALSLVCAQGGRRIHALLPAEPPPTLSLLVGPEGGLGGEELAQVEAAGYLPARLGPYNLRTETAGPAALAIVSSTWAC